MGFSRKLKYFIVQHLKVSNSQCIEYLIDGKILVNGKVTRSNIEIKPEDSIIFDNQILQLPTVFKYVAFYKPRGIETTLNSEIKDNLADILPFKERLFPVGRLDKDSEGLLLLTNDGRKYDKTLRNEHGTEKEYHVTVNKLITELFLEKMSEGIVIIGKRTIPCIIEKMSDFEFRIILVQGLNRQIRRMCYKLDYEVTRLIRVRIGSVKIETLKPLEWREI